MSLLELRNIDKYYGKNHVVKSLDLIVNEGEFLTILGPSGCGKTTLLRMIGGFEIPSRGSIMLKGQDITSLPPYLRNVNTVFQNYALFPHKNVKENIAFGLEQKKIDKNSLANKVEEVLEMVQMSNFANRKPSELSGGQQQRVAIARAVVNKPDILLLDEPLGALDLKLRKQMQFELKSLQKQLNYTFIYVTHDQEEALTMSDRIAVMHQGSIDQLDTPHKIYNEPITEFVTEFIGDINRLQGEVITNGQIRYHEYTFFADTRNIAPHKKVNLFIRPEHIEVHPSEGIEGKIKQSIFSGTHLKLMIQLIDGTFIHLNQSLENGKTFPLDESIYLQVKSGKAIVFEAA